MANLAISHKFHFCHINFWSPEIEGFHMGIGFDILSSTQAPLFGCLCQKWDSMAQFLVEMANLAISHKFHFLHITFLES